MLGGPTNFCNKPEQYLAHTSIIKPIFAMQSGYVSAINTRNIGLSLIELKGGRTRSDQKLDYATGFSNFCQIGDKIEKDTPLCFVHAQSDSDFERAKANILNNITISDKQPILTPEIIEKIGV